MSQFPVPLGEIEEEPDVTLCAWSVMKALLPAWGGMWTFHLVGWRVETTRGRASTPISLIDPVRRRCRTRSGSVYELQGLPGATADALVAWARFGRANKLGWEEDVTDDLHNLFIEQADGNGGTP